MIHGASNDPVLIKKIHLRLWTLRNEVENSIRLLVQQKKRKLTDEEIELVKKEFDYSQPVRAENNLLLLQGGKDEAANESGEENVESPEAEAAEEAPEEEVKAEGEEGEEDLEAAMAAAMGDGSSEDQEEQENDAVTAESLKIIQRTSASLPAENIVKGVSILSELSIESMAFFTNKPFLMGQSIVIEFMVPKKFVINADIVLCRPINIKSKIISTDKLSYRVIAKFTFPKQGERTVLRNLLKSVEPEVPAAPIKAKKISEEDEEDFDDLDSLDF